MESENEQRRLPEGEGEKGGARWKKRKGMREEKERLDVPLGVWIYVKEMEKYQGKKHTKRMYVHMVVFCLFCFVALIFRGLFPIIYSTYFTHSLTYSLTQSHSHTHAHLYTLCQFPPDFFHLFFYVY